MKTNPRARRLAVTAALALTAAAVLSACSSSTDSQAGAPGPRSTGPATGPATSPASGPASRTTPATTAAGTSSPAASTPAASTSAAAADTAPVHISLFSADGVRYGVGMPVIAYFSRMITDAAALQDATTVTVDGAPAQGAWYFEQSGAGHGPLEAHLRLKSYWPAHARVHVAIPAKGLSAGKGLAYDDSLTLDFTTGARTISVVDNATHTITVTRDGKRYGTFPVSLGAKGSPTLNGTKVIMEKDEDTRMQGTSLSGPYDDPHVYWTQRLTYGGEYLHAAPWNSPAENNGIGNIGTGNSSNGCTNLTTADAKKLYGIMRVGDVVKFPNADGPKMQMSDGYSDWNITWAQWRTGGLISTT